MSSARILLVEDDPDFASLVRDGLARAGGTGLEVAHAGTLAEALALLGGTDFDLVVTDLDLPDSKGLDTVAALAANGERLLCVLTGGESGRREAAIRLGALDLVHKDALRPAELERLAGLARRVAAGRRTRLDRTYRAMTEANEAILKAKSEQEVFDRACEIAVEVGGFVFATVLRLDADRCMTRVAARGEGARYPQPVRPSLDGPGLAAVACRTRGPVISNDFMHDPRVGVVRERIPYPVGSVAVFPLFADDEVTGIFVLRHERAHAFTDELAGLLGRVADNISFAQTSFRHEAARVRAEQLRGLEHSVAHVLAAARSVPEALKAVLREVCETIGAECGRYFHLDEAGAGMRFREGWAADAEMARFLEDSQNLRFERGKGLVGLVWQSGEVLWSVDASNDPRVFRRDLARAIGVHSTLVVPVSVEGQVAGVLSISARRMPPPDPRLLDTLRVAGTQIGQYLQRQAREAALARFRTALDRSADLVLLVDLQDGAKLMDFNETACYMLGYTREELLGQASSIIVADLGPDALGATHRALLGKPDRTDLVVRTYRRKDGSTFEVEVLRKVVESGQGPILVLNARDLTERRRIEERQAANLRYQESTARLGQSALGRREAAGLLEDALASLEEGLGCDAVAFVERVPGVRTLAVRGARGLPDGMAQSTEGAELAEAARRFGWHERYASLAGERVLGEQGERGALYALAAAPGAFGPEETRFLAATASVLSAGLLRIESEQRLAFLAQFDVLTGLPNRALLRDRFSQLIVQAGRHGAALGLLFIDLDDFKLVNDSLGHAGGDELLGEVARRLLAAVRPGDTVARISGDEFAIVLADLARVEDAALVAQKVIERLARPAVVAGQEVFVTASVGIATYPADGDDAEALIAAADAAMYRAKQAGRNGYQFYTAEINLRTRARAQLGSELRRALERDEFTLVYQAKFDLKSGIACAAEALLRWRHPERGLVAPGEFIPVLEETGLIVAVGEQVLRKACADLRAWQAAGLRAVPVAVNLSARQFRQQDLQARILEALDAAGVAPGMIELEITESQLMHEPEHAERVLRALSDAGIRVAIDDFGTGYSSLSYLTRFPVSALKVDRSFVSDVLADPADAAIVRAIIDMAHTLGFTVIAEGVETEAQAALLRSLGCEQAQGYYFARPVPAAEFAALIAAGAPSALAGVRRGGARPRRTL